MPRHECPGGHFAGGTTMPTTPSPVSQPPALSQTSPQQLSHPPLQLLDTTQTSSRPVTPESPSSLVS